jgi:hypothetical protein
MGKLAPVCWVSVCWLVNPSGYQKANNLTSSATGDEKLEYTMGFFTRVLGRKDLFAAVSLFLVDGFPSSILSLRRFLAS